ncbi:MAG: hypothetical protein H7343_11390 [Undibacterium sp.]|nr:hypothetical protein [Opitutaceae bacterium]
MPTPSSLPVIALVIPVFNEEAVLPVLFARLGAVTAARDRPADQHRAHVDRPPGLGSSPSADGALLRESPP